MYFKFGNQRNKIEKSVLRHGYSHHSHQLWGVHNAATMRESQPSFLAHLRPSTIPLASM